MRRALTVLTLLISAGASATKLAWNGADGDNYWNRGFGMAQAAETHNVTLRVKSIDEMISKVDALMSAAGGTGYGSGNTYTNNHNGSAQKYRQMSYTLPLKAAEKAAKKAFDLGELMNYSMNRNQGDMKKQVDERVAQLEKELGENKAALEKMPAAKYFLSSKLEQLKKVQESYETSASKGMVTVTLQENPQKP
jgi:hypothetical protein